MLYLLQSLLSAQLPSILVFRMMRHIRMVIFIPCNSLNICIKHIYLSIISSSMFYFIYLFEELLSFISSSVLYNTLYFIVYALNKIPPFGVLSVGWFHYLLLFSFFLFFLFRLILIFLFLNFFIWVLYIKNIS